MQLARGNIFVGSVRMAVDVQRAHTANAFTAVVVEHDRLFAFVDQIIVQNIQHFEERRVGRNILHRVLHKFPFGLGVLLTPYL